MSVPTATLGEPAKRVGRLHDDAGVSVDRMTSPTRKRLTSHVVTASVRRRLRSRLGPVSAREPRATPNDNCPEPKDNRHVSPF